jgi:hypothetical protein
VSLISISWYVLLLVSYAFILLCGMSVTVSA